MIALVLSISIPLVLITILIGSFYTSIRALIRGEFQERGTLLFKVDFKTRRIMLFNLIENVAKNRVVFKSNKKGVWVPLNKLTASFVGTKGIRLLRNMFLQADSKKEDHQKIEFEVDNSNKKHALIKRSSFTYSIELKKFEENDFFLLTVRWIPIIKKKRRVSTWKPLEVTDIVESNKIYKTFVAFNISRGIVDANRRFKEIISKVIGVSRLDFIVSRGMFIMVFSDHKIKKLQKEVNFFLNIVKTDGYENGLNHLYTGSGIVSAKDINSSKRFNAVLKTLDYNINLSIRHKEAFVNIQDKKFSGTEYKKFTDGSQLFRTAIKTKDIDTKLLPIRSSTTNRKIINYAYPTIKGVSDDIMKLILKNGYNKKMIINAYSNIVSFTREIGAPALIDINSEWLKLNHSKLTVKKMIYVISFVKYEDVILFKELIAGLRAKGFVFAIRINMYTETIVTMVKNVNPQFLVIDDKLISENTASSYIKLLSIRQLATAYNIKIIFENPEKIEKNEAEKIQVEYFYET